MAGARANGCPASAGQSGVAFKGEQVYGQLTGTIAPTRVELSGGYSVTHGAEVQRVAGLTAAELKADLARLIEAREALIPVPTPVPVLSALGSGW